MLFVGSLVEEVLRAPGVRGRVMVVLLLVSSQLQRTGTIQPKASMKLDGTSPSVV